MAAQEKALGNWNQLKGKVKQRWGQLTDDELSEVEGNFEQLIGLIQQKSGESREQVERIVGEFSENVGGAVKHATEAMREYAGYASGAIRDSAEQARECTMETYEGAKDVVRRRPAESAAVALAIGFGLGIAIGISLAGPRRRPSSWRDRLTAEDLGHRILHRFEDVLPQRLANWLEE